MSVHSKSLTKISDDASDKSLQMWNSKEIGGSVIATRQN